MPRKILTLATLHNKERILLGLKKQGLGKGKWNGFGGKVEEGESIEEAALREVKEEAYVTLPSLEKRGVITFSFEGNPELLEVHIFSAFFDGVAKESDEMKPEWFNIKEIPYDKMWKDDKIWLPMLLAGKNFEGEVFFKDADTIIRHTIRQTNS